MRLARFLFALTLTTSLLAHGATQVSAQRCSELFFAKPSIFIVSAPSGGGKTTLIKKLIEKSPQAFAVSVSATTRSPRPGEINGVDYHFLSQAEFKKRLDAGEFVEWTEFAGNFYGTSRVEVESLLAQGKSVFLNVTVDGAQTLKKKFPEQVRSIFIRPPSLEVLERRLRARGTETEASLQKRLNQAEKEMKEQNQFDFVIVNDDLNTAFQDFEAVTTSAAAAGK